MVFLLLSRRLSFVYLPCQFSFSSFLVELLQYRFPYGLAVRNPGFHPGGPGSTPGMGIARLSFFFFCFFKWKKSWHIPSITHILPFCIAGDLSALLSQSPHASNMFILAFCIDTKSRDFLRLDLISFPKLGRDRLFVGESCFP